MPTEELKKILGNDDSISEETINFYKMVKRKIMKNVVRVFGSVYDHPKLYDVLFSASWKAEVAFLGEMIRRSPAAGRRASIFEPACGTGRLLWRLARQGHQVLGLDLNAKAVDFCNRRLRKHGLPETARVGDMTDFTLASLERPGPFDLAFNFVSSFLHLTTERLAEAHLRCTAAAMNPGGLYLLGLHLLPDGEAQCSRESWTTRRGGLALRSHLERQEIDFRKRRETVHFRIEAETPTRHYEVCDTFPLRTYTAPQFLRLLRKTPEWEVVGTFDFALDWRNPVTVDSQTEDAVFVLRKR